MTTPAPAATTPAPAAAPPRTRATRLSGWAVAIVVAVATLLALAAMLTAPNVQAGVAGTWRPGAATLRLLADSLVASPADATTGRFSYVDTRTYGRDGLPDQAGVARPAVLRVQRWWAFGGAGRYREFDETRGCRPRGGDSTSSAGMPGMFDTEPSTDPDTLRRQLLAHQPAGETGPVHVLAGVPFMAEQHYANRPVRAALLRILAAVPAITARAPVTDRAGRPGLGLSLVSEDGLGTPLRHTLIIDPTTGVLLAYDITVAGPLSTRRPPGLAADPCGAACLEGHRLFLDLRRTASTTTPNTGCR